jgi:hypothetical protein
MAKRFSRPVTWIGLLAVLTVIMVFGRPGLSSIGDYIEALLFSSTKPFPFKTDDCSDRLFSSSVPRSKYVDFCKELVIIDPDVLGGMPELSFRNVMGDLLGPIDADTFMGTWAGTWAVMGQDQPTRGNVSEPIRTAWEKDRIKLIAVVNRLDLALSFPLAPAPDPKAPLVLGEGRLVYQMFAANGTPMDMTFILEFAYPPLDAQEDKEGNLELWANNWQELTKAVDAGKFRDRLRLVIKDFALPLQLRRIRTNEKLKGVGADGKPYVNSTWAFREYKFVGCAQSAVSTPCLPQLEWVSLRDTPLDQYRGYLSLDLQEYLGLQPVINTLQKGIHKLGTYDDPQKPIRLDVSAEIVPTKATWGSPLLMDESRFLMAFNTCNGCHSDFKYRYDVFPHIAIPPGGKETELSSFLTKQVPMEHELAGCRDVKIWHGCEGDKENPLWDEQMHRVYYYYSKLSTTKAMELPRLSEPNLQYRYH